MARRSARGRQARLFCAWLALTLPAAPHAGGGEADNSFRDRVTVGVALRPESEPPVLLVTVPEPEPPPAR